jgi:hypothetical protein
MPFTVIWAESVIEQLAGLWLDAGDKGRFSGAIAEIDRVLSTSPHAAGRLLHEGIMVCSRNGVSVLFEIRDNDCIVDVVLVKKSSSFDEASGQS